MKKILVLIGILLCMPFFVVDATQTSAEDGIMIEVRGINDSDQLLGRLDLLVKRDEVDRMVFSEPSEDYKAMFGDLNNLDYLKEDDSIWISYLAYVEDANVILHNPSSSYLFASDEGEYLSYSEIKIVFLAEDKSTLYISDEITIEHPKRNEQRYGEIEFYASEPFDVTNYYTIGSWGAFTSVIVIGIVGIVLSIGVITGLTIIMVKLMRKRRRCERID
ncbi:MAG: hypothetical protein LRY20_01185 [Acholeplasmataceae bacterium]|nr:hypothetical protein [Acholeplasmataceae bacterium]